MEIYRIFFIIQPGMPYKFAYAVEDAASYNSYGHQESSDGKVVSGSYRVALLDGRTQTVTYKVDGYSGFVADVKYEGEAKHPQYSGSTYKAAAYPNKAKPTPAAYPAPTKESPSYPTPASYPAPAYPAPTKAPSYPAPAVYSTPAYPGPAKQDPSYPAPSAYPAPSKEAPSYPKPTKPAPKY